MRKTVTIICFFPKQSDPSTRASLRTGATQNIIVHSEGFPVFLKLMRLMDEHYTDHCFKGANRRHTWLTMDKGYKVKSQTYRKAVL